MSPPAPKVSVSWWEVSRLEATRTCFSTTHREGGQGWVSPPGLQAEQLGHLFGPKLPTQGYEVC